METTTATAGHEAIGQDDRVVHDWRVAQLKRLGIPALLAETSADHVDWHRVAELIRRGCPPLLALRIVR